MMGWASHEPTLARPHRILDAYITPYATAAPGAGACFTTGEIIACATNPAMPRSSVAWTSGTPRPGYADPCLTCQGIETFPGTC